MQEKNPLTKQFIITEMARLKAEREARNNAAQACTQDILRKFMLAKTPGLGG